MTYWNCNSFDMYSNRKEPLCSEKSEIIFQYASSASSRGRVSAALQDGTVRRNAVRQTTHPRPADLASRRQTITQPPLRKVSHKESHKDTKVLLIFAFFWLNPIYRR